MCGFQDRCSSRTIPRKTVSLTCSILCSFMHICIGKWYFFCLGLNNIKFVFFRFKCVCIISFIFFQVKIHCAKPFFQLKRRFPCTWWKPNVPANIFSVLSHSSWLKSLLIFCFDLLNLKLFDFQTAKGKENI